MADVPKFCPYCGQAYDLENRPDVKFCDNCGKPKSGTSGESSQPSNYAMILNYDPGVYLTTPKMQIKCGEHTIVLVKKQKHKLELPPGQYHLEFKSSLRKSNLDVDLNKDIEVVIGWNRLSGKISVHINQ